MNKFTACGIQFAPRPNAIEENMARLTGFIEKAVREIKPQLIVLQETCTTGFTPNMPVPEFYKIIERIPGKSTGRMCDLARKYKTAIVFPVYEKGNKKNTVYNSAVVITSDGKIKGVYRKTHPFPTERKWTTPGTKLLVSDLGVCKLGLMICYEGDFPEIARCLTVKGAEVIARPSALLRSFEVWDLTTRARAYDNHVYVIAVNSVGADAGNNYFFGHSMIVSPIAQKLAQARGTEEMIFARLDNDPIKYVTYGSKVPMIFDHMEDRNLGIYKHLLKESKSRFNPYKRIPYRKIKRGG